MASITGRPLPPIENWNPNFCGDVDIEIRRDGSWWHEGAEIRRRELVELFASILCRDDDGDYYLVTPVEKTRIRVALHPLIVVDFEPAQGGEEPTLVAVLNTGGTIEVGREYPLSLEPQAGNAAYISLDRGLTALCSRAAWYRLAEMVDDNGCVLSNGQTFSLVT